MRLPRHRLASALPWTFVAPARVARHFNPDEVEVIRNRVSRWVELEPEQWISFSTDSQARARACQPHVIALSHSLFSRQAG